MTWTPDQQQNLLRIIQRRNERDVLRHQLTQTNAELTRLRQQQALLQNQWQAEQDDVDRLNRLSWASVFYSLIDKKDQQLSKEEAEAQQARLRYDAVTAGLTELEKQQQNQQARLTAYTNVDADYEQIIGTKQLVVANSSSTAYEPYKQQVAALSHSNRMLQELQEAHTAGLQALNEVISLNKLLSQASTLGAWDLLGGSTFASIIKYNKLDDVREQSYRVTHRLQQFQTEYADLDRSFATNWQFDDGTTRFVDIFFDNAFTDWSVQSRINKAKDAAQTLESQLVSAIATLKHQIEQAGEQTKQEAEKLQLLLEQL